MLKKWEIVPAPSEKNPARHKLLIKGEMKDIFLVVKKLGGVCSRPEKTSGGYDFLIYLSRLEADVTTKLKAVSAELGSIEISEEAAPPAAAPKLAVEPGYFTPAPAPAPAQQAPQQINLEPRHAPAPQPEPAPPPLEPEPAPAPLLEPEPRHSFQPAPGPASGLQLEPRHSPAGPVPAPQFQQPAPAPQFPQTPAPVPQFAAQQPAPVPEPEQPAAAQETPPHVTGPRKNFVPSVSSRMKLQDMEQPHAPAPAPAPAKEEAPQAPAKAKSKWPMELPLIPTYNFQTLVSGSHNRFAHAAAMAVVENPGVIYNPLLLCGGPGTGKTHFVNAVSTGLAKTLGQAQVFVTDGVKFAKGVELALAEGGLQRLNTLFDGIKALVIDDVHLLMITAANKEPISKWLNGFVAKNKQIVVTSLFPPKSLAGLEDAVGFQFTQGWMVDLKQPAAQTYKIILNQLLQGMDVKLSEAEIGNIFANQQMPLGEAVGLCESVKKLEKFVVTSNNGLTHAQLLEMLLGMTEAPPQMLTKEALDVAASWSPSTGDEWFRWGIFYPRGLRAQAQYALYMLHERAKELGINTEWSQVFMEEYNQDEAYGTPFNIGNAAGKHNVNGVIVLGPQPTSAIGAQENDFRNLTVKVLDSFSVKSSWVPFKRLSSPSVYARVLMDLI